MRVLLQICIFLIAATSCNKTCQESPKEMPNHFNATVLWSGSPASDGLGWVLRFENGKMEKPSNLSGQFEINGLKVYVEYESTSDKYPCFCAGGSINMIRIVSIVKR